MDIWGIWEYTAVVSVAGLLIWLIKLIFHDKLDARWHYLIWLVLLVRMVTPLRFRMVSAPFSVFREVPVGKWLEFARLLAEKRGHGDVFSQLGQVWLWGAVVLGGWYLCSWTALRIQVGRMRKADPALREYVDQTAAKYGLKSCRDIRTGKSRTPFICGLVRPVLVLPEDWAAPEEEIIVHELLHKKFGDVLVNIGLHIVRIINWFNPVVWALASAVQNDGEALCDQRVLELCGRKQAQRYGRLLIDMGEGRHPVKIGTSNMASSYRNMKTRIRRIRDFQKVPGRIGLVTLCITLMMALACIGNPAKAEEGFTMPSIETSGDMEMALLHARCWHACTPEQAVYLFLRAFEQKNAVYRMIIMPGEDISGYEEYVLACMENGEDILEPGSIRKVPWEDGSGERIPPYFPKAILRVIKYDIYNLQYSDTEGSATVCVTSQGINTTEWKLSLVKEDGWKVRLAGESQTREGQYGPESMLSASARLGDFQVEVKGYNSGYFAELNAMAGIIRSSIQSEAAGQEETFPVQLSQEYKIQDAYVTYLGEEDLTGHRIKVLVTPREDADNEWVMEQLEQEKQLEEAYVQGYRPPWSLDTGTSSYGSSNGCGFSVFNGREMMAGEPRLVNGGGEGFIQPGMCWKADDKMSIYVRIFVDGTLREEGEVWNGQH